MRRFFIIGGGLALFLALNVAFIAPGSFIPPAKFFLNERFSYKLHSYRALPTVDLLIMGNSRADCCLDPHIFAKILSKSWNRDSVSVHSLTTGGGYFPFYSELLTNILQDQPPKRLLLSISPRDFNQREGRSTKVQNRLLATSGYTLNAIPYAGLFHWLEGRLADSLAATFPFLYYRSRTLAALIPDALASWARPQRGNKKQFWRRSVWQAIGNLPLKESILPENMDEFQRRLASYPKRLKTLGGRQPDNNKIVDSNGWWQVPERISQPLAKRQAAWNDFGYQEKRQKMRHGKLCEREFKLDERPEALHHPLLQYLEEKKVTVFLAQLPALWLEGCENNYAANEQLQKYLPKLKERYKNIAGIFDLNHNFAHSRLDLKHYTDLGEHMNRATGAEVSQELGRLIADSTTP